MNNILLCDEKFIIAQMNDLSIIRYNLETHENKKIVSAPKKSEVKYNYIINYEEQVLFLIKNGVLYIIKTDKLARICMPDEKLKNTLSVGKKGLYTYNDKSIYLFNYKNWTKIYETRYNINCINSDPNMDDIYIYNSVDWLFRGIHKENLMLDVRPVLMCKNITYFKIDPNNRGILIYMGGNIKKILRYVIKEENLYVLDMVSNYKKYKNDNTCDSGFYDITGNFYSPSGVWNVRSTEQYNISQKAICINGSIYHVLDDESGIVYKDKKVIAGFDVIGFRYNSIHYLYNLYYGKGDLYLVYKMLDYIEKDEKKTIVKPMQTRHRPVETYNNPTNSYEYRSYTKRYDVDNKYKYYVHKFEKCRYCGKYIKYSCIDHKLEYKYIILATFCKVVYGIEDRISKNGIDASISRIIYKYLD